MENQREDAAPTLLPSELGFKQIVMIDNERKMLGLTFDGRIVKVDGLRNDSILSYAMLHDGSANLAKRQEEIRKAEEARVKAAAEGQDVTDLEAARDAEAQAAVRGAEPSQEEFDKLVHAQVADKLEEQMDMVTKSVTKKLTQQFQKSHESNAKELQKEFDAKLKEVEDEHRKQVANMATALEHTQSQREDAKADASQSAEVPDSAEGDSGPANEPEAAKAESKSEAKRKAAQAKKDNA